MLKDQLSNSLCTYELQRLENIKRNELMLQQLEIGRAKDKVAIQKRIQKKKPQVPQVP